MPDISTMPAACGYMGTVTGLFQSKVDLSAPQGGC